MPNRVPTGKTINQQVVPKQKCPHNFIGMTADGYKFCQSCMKIFNWRGDNIK